MQLNPSNKRRESKTPTVKRRMSRHGSVLIETAPRELPWDLIDRLLVPIICCHAAAILISGVLNLLRISQVSAFVLFILFSILTVSVALVYHCLKITTQKQVIEPLRLSPEKFKGGRIAQIVTFTSDGWTFDCDGGPISNSDNNLISPLGKAVLITGCESALARALAKHLDDLGFTVFAAFKLLQDNDDATMLKAVSSGRLKLLQLDVTSEIEMLEASLLITKHLPDGEPGLWALIHCDLWCALGELEWVPFPVMRKSFDINVLGASRLTQIMLPLIRRSNGRVVFLSSALAHLPSPVRSVQCATQAAIEGLAACLRQELKPRKVGVSIICASEFGAGNAWLDDQDMREQAKAMWELLSEEQKEAYGEDYFEQAIRSLEPYSRGDGDFHSTIRAMTDSIMRTFPMFRYTPLTRYEKLKTIVAEHLPSPLYEVLYKA